MERLDEHSAHVHPKGRKEVKKTKKEGDRDRKKEARESKAGWDGVY